MTLRHMKIFVAVCNENSITRAAEKMYLAQPAVSLAVKELEDYYQIKLFDRISRRLYLTQAGRKMLDYAKHIVALFDEMEQNVRNWDSFGKLRIGASITVGTCYMPLYVSRFKEEHTQTEISVIIDSSDVIEAKILSSDLDFAVIEGITHSDNLICETFKDDKLVVISSNKNKFSENHTISPAEFCSQNFLLRENGSGTRELLDNTLAAAGYSVKPLWESTSTTALINATAADIGISVLPYQLVKTFIDNGIVSILNVVGIEFNRKFNIIYHKNKYLTEAARQFIDMCKML